MDEPDTQTSKPNWIRRHWWTLIAGISIPAILVLVFVPAGNDNTTSPLADACDTFETSTGDIPERLAEAAGHLTGTVYEPAATVYLDAYTNGSGTPATEDALTMLLELGCGGTTVGVNLTPILETIEALWTGDPWKADTVAKVTDAATDDVDVTVTGTEITVTYSHPQQPVCVVVDADEGLVPTALLGSTVNEACTRTDLFLGDPI